MANSSQDDYNCRVQQLREQEYPMLRDTTYLDHAGTTIPAKSLMERFSTDMISNLYGNPHSASIASQNTSKRIEDARLRLLDLFHADPDEFDVVFVANATAGIKLVVDAFRDSEEGYWYGYHRDSHTSLIGAREHAKQHVCFGSDHEVESWIQSSAQDEGTHRQRLVAYPAQSNMNGRRLPLDWCRQLRQLRSTYSLLDAAALVSTSPLSLSNACTAPDFTVLSLYKIFGFPDLGALIVRRSSAHVFQSRKYFGGGTVDMVVCLKEQWHAKKVDSIHERLEDGTLPVHNILALHSALDVHRDLYGSLDRVSKHCSFLAKKLHDSLSALRHGNGREVCMIYQDTSSSDYSNAKTQGPIVAFNVRNIHGGWVTNSEVEKLASIRNIHLRTGGLCNPGGMASALQLEPWEMKRNFSAGHRCGNEEDVMYGKPTGMIRLSLGAMSTIKDIDTFIEFMHEFFVESTIPTPDVITLPPPTNERWYVESLSVYPIKSCAGWRVPPQMAWMINKEGLAWDREWCLVRPGTGTALSQKRYPRMALIRPVIDLEQGVLRIAFADRTAGIDPISVPLSLDPSLFSSSDFALKDAKVCEDTVAARIYQSSMINDFFTQALGVACQLARFPANGSLGSTRHAKAHLQPFQQRKARHIPGAFPEEVQVAAYPPRPILLSNESPILTISRSSLNRLNEQIKSSGGKAAHAEVFRANIVVAEYHRSTPGFQEPYAEDHWHMMQIGSQFFQFLGSCRRCQMVCVDQETAMRNQEPFSTLAKTRRIDGKVYFGQHTCHIQMAQDGSPQAQRPTIMVGDAVNPCLEG